MEAVVRQALAKPQFSSDSSRSASTRTILYRGAVRAGATSRAIGSRCRDSPWSSEVRAHAQPHRSAWLVHSSRAGIACKHGPAAAQVLGIDAIEEIIDAGRKQNTLPRTPCGVDRQRRETLGPSKILADDVALVDDEPFLVRHPACERADRPGVALVIDAQTRLQRRDLRPRRTIGLVFSARVRQRAGELPPGPERISSVGFGAHGPRVHIARNAHASHSLRVVRLDQNVIVD